MQNENRRVRVVLKDSAAMDCVEDEEPTKVITKHEAMESSGKDDL